MTRSFTPWRRLALALAGLALAGPLAAAQPRANGKPPQAPASAPAAAASAEAVPREPTPAEPVSRDAQRAYETTRDKLVQVRTLLRNTNSQASVGSGFFVSDDGLIITNFHVASQLALEPDQYRGVAVPVDGKEIELQLLAFDVPHDLALLRAKGGGTTAALGFRAKDRPLARGERLYSLGNPLDIGFAVTEGTYNGQVQRSFYPRIFFAGALNPGMSGGPALDDAGRVIGVNVAKRLDGELVSFLIPGEFAQALLARAANAKPITQKSQAEVARQLLVHQAAVAQKFLGTPFKAQLQAGYSVPVPDDALVRCWGRARDPDFKAFDLERTNCQLDSQVFTGDSNTGYIRIRSEAYNAPKFSALRFAAMYSASMRNEFLVSSGSARVTPSECNERYIDREGMPMRAVVCVNAQRKLPGLYDASAVVMSLNRPTQGVQGRIDVQGFSFDNTLALVAFYINGFKWAGGK
jgi:S1-C subfamily serine protease